MAKFKQELTELVSSSRPRIPLTITGKGCSDIVNGALKCGGKFQENRATGLCIYATDGLIYKGGAGWVIPTQSSHSDEDT